MQYTPEGSDTVLASEMPQGQSTTTATVDRPPEATSTDTVPPAPAPAPAHQEQPTTPLQEEAQQRDDDIGVVSEQPVDDSGRAEVGGDAADSDSGQEASSEPDQRPWGLPVPGPAPTAATMTARGAELLSEGKLQEAIDQFTKAIALDPRHREAFERRAAAYSQQGREDRAQEDLQQLQALNAGS